MTAAEPGAAPSRSTASSGDLKGVEPGRCSVPWMYSLCQRIRPCLASSIAFSRVSAMCQLSSTRQFLRSTVVPFFLAADSAKPHCVGSAVRPSLDIEPSEMMPMPYLPAKRHARRADLRGDGERHVLLQRQELQGRVLQGEPVALVGDALAAQQAADDADRLVLAVALGHRVDAERVGVGRQRARARAEDRAAAAHPVELDHALRDVERVVVGQRDHAGRELDALGVLGRRGQEHLGRGDHLPARRMMLAAPELVEAELVEVLHELDVAAELQHRVFADRVMGGEECAETEPRHAGLPGNLCDVGRTW